MSRFPGFLLVICRAATSVYYWRGSRFGTPRTRSPTTLTSASRSAFIGHNPTSPTAPRLQHSSPTAGAVVLIALLTAPAALARAAKRPAPCWCANDPRRTITAPRGAVAFAASGCRRQSPTEKPRTLAKRLHRPAHHHQRQTERSQKRPITTTDRSPQPHLNRSSVPGASWVPRTISTNSHPNAKLDRVRDLASRCSPATPAPPRDSTYYSTTRA